MTKPITQSELTDVFASFANTNVLIIGDVMVDSYIWGRVERISPEAPVPIVVSQKRENRLGGAANVAMNVKALDANPIMCAVIGDDHHSDLFLGLLKELNMTQIGIIKHPKRVTTVKTRIIGNHHHMLRVDDEIDTNLPPDIEQLYIDHVCKIINTQSIHSIIFQDYDKGIITPKVIEDITQLAKQKNIPTLVDPKKRNFLNYKNVTLFKPNFKELCEGLNLQIQRGDFQGINQAANILHAQQNIDYVFITLSELGVYISNGNRFQTIPTQVRDVADVSGAGDTVVATAGVCMAKGLDVMHIAAIANIAGGIVCEKVGVVPVDKIRLLKDSIEFLVYS